MTPEQILLGQQILNNSSDNSQLSSQKLTDLEDSNNVEKSLNIESSPIEEINVVDKDLSLLEEEFNRVDIYHEVETQIAMQQSVKKVSCLKAVWV